MGNLFIFVGQVAHLVIQIIQIMIVIHVVISWIGTPLPLNQLTRFMYSTLEAIYMPIRSIIPTQAGTMDFTPFVALLLLNLINRYVILRIIITGYDMLNR